MRALAPRFTRAACRWTTGAGELPRCQEAAPVAHLKYNWPHDTALFDQNVVVSVDPDERGREQRSQPEPNEARHRGAPNFLSVSSPHAVSQANPERGQYCLQAVRFR